MYNVNEGVVVFAVVVVEATYGSLRPLLTQVNKGTRLAIFWRGWFNLQHI